MTPLPLAAHAEERLDAPIRRHRPRSGFLVLLALVVLIHAVGLGFLLYRDATAPLELPPPLETPIEVIQEPPPKPEEPPPPEKKEEKKPESKAEEKKPPPPRESLEKPAYSAPRASKEPAKTKGTAPKTAAPKTSEPPREAAAPETPPTEDRKEAKSRLADDKSEAEALDKASPDPEDKPDAPAVKPKPKRPVAKAPEVEGRIVAPADLPDPSLADSAAMQPFPEGTEDNRYLAVVYGMVMSKNHYRGSSAERRHATGSVSVVFVVDPFGHVRHQEVVRSSGEADLDALAMNAVRSAGPFPPPPGSGSQSLVATMTFGIEGRR
jgi:protein TonB